MDLLEEGTSYDKIIITITKEPVRFMWPTNPIKQMIL